MRYDHKPTVNSCSGVQLLTSVCLLGCHTINPEHQKNARNSLIPLQNNLTYAKIDKSGVGCWLMYRDQSLYSGRSLGSKQRWIVARGGISANFHRYPIFAFSRYPILDIGLIPTNIRYFAICPACLKDVNRRFQSTVINKEIFSLGLPIPQIRSSRKSHSVLSLIPPSDEFICPLRFTPVLDRRIDICAIPSLLGSYLTVLEADRGDI